MFGTLFEMVLGVDGDMIDFELQNQISEHCKFDRNKMIFQIQQFMDANKEIDRETAGIVLEQCLVSALINHLYRALQMLDSPTGINYFGIMHFFHHGANRKKYILEELNSLMITAGNSLSLSTVVMQISRLFEGHVNVGRSGAGLHTNSFDTFLLQFLYNEATPKGLFRSSLAEIFETYPLTRMLAQRQAPGLWTAADLEQVQNERVSTAGNPTHMGTVVTWLKGPSSNNSLRLLVSSRQRIREEAKLYLYTLCTLVDDFKIGKALVGAPVVDIEEEKAHRQDYSHYRSRS